MQNDNHPDNSDQVKEISDKEIISNQGYSIESSEIITDKNELPCAFDNIDLSIMTTDQLRQVEQNVKRERKLKSEKVLLSKWKDFISAVNETDMSISDAIEVCNPTLAKGSKKTSKIRYRNPDNQIEGWTGRGRKPKWFISCVEKGIDPKDLEV